MDALRAFKPSICIAFTPDGVALQVLDSKVVLDRPARTGLKAQRVAECTVGDDSGLILFSARNEQGEPSSQQPALALRSTPPPGHADAEPWSPPACLPAVDAVQPGSYITLRNAKTEMFRSSMRVVVDRFGKIDADADADFEPNSDLNMSLIEYELVQVPSEAASVKAAEAATPGAEAPADAAGEPEAAAPAAEGAAADEPTAS